MDKSKKTEAPELDEGIEYIPTPEELEELKEIELLEKIKANQDRKADLERRRKALAEAMVAAAMSRMVANRIAEKIVKELVKSDSGQELLEMCALNYHQNDTPFLMALGGYMGFYGKYYTQSRQVAYNAADVESVRAAWKSPGINDSHEPGSFEQFCSRMAK